MLRQLIARLFLSSSLCASCAVAAGIDAAETIPLWPGKAPGSEQWTHREADTHFAGHIAVRNVVEPSLIRYSPTPGKANGSAVIIAPGGGFLFLTMDAEGSEVADWLTARGVTAFVLKYRLSDTGASEFSFNFKVAQLFLGAMWDSLFSEPGKVVKSDRFKHIIPLAAADGLQAVKLVRERATEWQIDPNRIGMIGFSAGGAVVNEAATQYDASNRPDFVASIYSTGLRSDKIPSDAPPVFIATAKDDPIVPAQFSATMDSVWRSAGRPSVLHIYDNGYHGYGIRKQQKASDRWIDDYERWLQAQQIILVPSVGNDNAESTKPQPTAG